MASNEQLWNENQLRRYPITFSQVPRVSWDSFLVDAHIEGHHPVVITGSDLVDSTRKWDLEYLEKSMTTLSCKVLLSKDHKFKFYDEKKVTPLLKKSFAPTAKWDQMTFIKFAERLRNWKEGNERMCLLHPMCEDAGMNVLKDFVEFNWEWLRQKEVKHNWEKVTSNLLQILMEGSIMSCHFDESENLFAQIKGFNRVMLFPPSQFGNLYPHRVDDPYDCQSQVDFENPDYETFPNMKDLMGLETVLGPGELLYIPALWFYQMESLLGGGYTISLSSWYKPPKFGLKEKPCSLKDYQIIVIMRNFEKNLFEVLEDWKKVLPCSKIMLTRRYE